MLFMNMSYFSLAIDFSSPGCKPWISFATESKIMHKLPTGMGGDFACFPNSAVGKKQRLPESSVLDFS